MALEADVRVTLKYAAGCDTHASYTLTAGDFRGPTQLSKAIGEVVEKTVREHLKSANEDDRTIYGISVEFGYRWRP